MTATAPVVAPRCPEHRPMRPRACQLCRRREHYKDAVRAAAVQSGTWEPMVVAAPVAEHCRMLRAAGMPYLTQAAITGLASGHVHSIARGKVARVQPTTAEALLSLTPPKGDEYSRWIDATGTRRRLRGLAVNGWSQAVLAARLGFSDRAVVYMTHKARVSRASADKVKALAAELYGLTGPSIEYVRRWVKPGWVPLEAWGDDIDDPDAVPDRMDLSTYVDEVAVLRAVKGELAYTGLSRADRVAAVTELAGRGMSDREIAVRLQWTDRYGKPGGAAVNYWRRVNGIAAGRNPDGRRVDTRYDTVRVEAAMRGEVKARNLGPLEKEETVRRLATAGMRDRAISELLRWHPDPEKGAGCVQTFRNKWRIRAARPKGSANRRDEQARVDLTRAA